MSRRRPVALALAALLALLVAGCSGVPRSSRPEALRTLGASSANADSDAPLPGADPRTIMAGFLTDARYPDAKHSLARQYLSPDAANKWLDNPVIVTLEDLDSYPVNPVAQGRVQITISYHQVGVLDASGVYTPEVKDKGESAVQTRTYTLAQVNGQWRIVDPGGAGVLLSRAQFSVSYSARSLYFFDSTDHTLVPDIRYAAQRDTSLCQWLFTQLLAGPRADLPTVQTQFPSQAQNNKGSSIDCGKTVTVDLPGSSQLDEQSRQRLAVQLAYTLNQASNFGGVRLALTDVDKPVDIPGPGATFAQSNFPSYAVDAPPVNAQLYYLRAGRLYGGDRKPVEVPAPLAELSLATVAISRSAQGDLRLAAVDSNGQLWTGSLGGTVHRVALPAGTRSAPEWRPDSDQAWIAVGGSLYSFTETAGRADKAATPANQGTGELPNGRIATLRFSPDGARVAVVVVPAGTQGELWVGAVDQANKATTLVDFAQVSPDADSVVDAAWHDSTSLYYITPSATDLVMSDGWSPESIDSSKLPTPLTSITAAVGLSPVVAAGSTSTLWSYSGAWNLLAATDTASAGTSPVYGF